MKKNGLFLALLSVLILLPNEFKAETIIKNHTSVSGIWTKAKSPYIIQGEAIVPEDAVLKIQPGVVILFKTGENREFNEDTFDLGFLRVNGVIIAEGTKSDPICFTRNDTTGFWGNIYVNSKASGISFKYCRIEYSYYVRNIIKDGNSTGALTFNNSKGDVSNCLFVYNGWTGFNCKNGATPHVEFCTFYGNEYGIECNTDSKPIFNSVIVWKNNNCFYFNSDAAPTFINSLVQKEFPEGVKDGGSNLIAVDPLFESTESFVLAKNSPCLKKGNDGKNIGAVEGVGKYNKIE